MTSFKPTAVLSVEFCIEDNEQQSVETGGIEDKEQQSVVTGGIEDNERQSVEIACK